MNIQIKKLNKDDLFEFVQLIKVFEEVFEMQSFEIPINNHLQNLLNKQDFFVFVAIIDTQVIGGLTAYTLEQYYSSKPLAYVYDLAVNKKLQRQGIGKLLMEAICNYCNENGFEEVFVQADRVDDYALAFYRKTMPTAEEDVSHFYYTLK
ncbi:MAG: GNAT family N-acetyltransferase [Bacteroidota bacterium]